MCVPERTLRSAQHELAGVVVIGHRLPWQVTPGSAARGLAALAATAEESRMRREKITAPAKKLYERLEKVVGTFCPGLAKAPLHIHRYGASH